MVKKRGVNTRTAARMGGGVVRQRIIYRLSGGVCACRSSICHKCRVVRARFSGGEKCRRKRTEKQPSHGKDKTNAAFFRRMHQAFVQSRNIRPRDDCQQDKHNPIEPPYMTPYEQNKRRKDEQRDKCRNHYTPEVFRMRRTSNPPRGHHRANQQDRSHDAPIGKENATPKNERRQGAFARQFMNAWRQATHLQPPSHSRLVSFGLGLNAVRMLSLMPYSDFSKIKP